MTDPLGQSQVIPYLIGLTKKGYLFSLISCEKKGNLTNEKKNIIKTLKENNIFWYPLTYTKSPPVLSTLWDILKIKIKAKALHKREHFQIIHCRSYIPSLIGLWMKKEYGVKFIFDMRGFWADERVDGDLWNQKKPVYKLIYGYFKKKEKEFLSEADYTITLTHAAKNTIRQGNFISSHALPIKVIPCCVNTDLFNPATIDHKLQIELRKEIGLQNSDFVLSYVGTLGTWYLLEEMLLFFKQLLSAKQNAKLLFITREKPDKILAVANKHVLPIHTIFIRKALHNEVPLYLSLSSVSIFFIKPVFSKIASFPVKLAEIVSMGIPVICNAGIGDIDKIVNSNTGIIVTELTPAAYRDAISNFDSIINLSSESIRQNCIAMFSLELGVEQYHESYQYLLSK